MTINAHAETFAGYPIKDYQPSVGLVSGAMRRREFHFTEGTAQKFWAIELDGSRHTVQFGRIGSAGQTQTKKFASAKHAQQAYEKLLAEKIKKGYVEVTSPAPAAGPVKPKKTAAAAAPQVIYRMRLSYDDDAAGKTFNDILADFLEQPGVDQIPGLVIGAWGYGGDDSAPVVEALVAARDQLPNLKALFLGDITYEENEISWIQQSDVSPLLAAYPRLEHFRVRGGNGLSLGSLKHHHLKGLVIESGGLPVAVVREVAAAKLPELEHLELWLGSPAYGSDATVEDLKPILSGKRFPKLQYLGLRDSEMADDVAAAVARAPLLQRIRVLDLSLGDLSDQGAEALLASPAVANLEKLDIHHHFVSAPVVKKLKALGITVDASDHKEPYEWDEEGNRYIAVSE
jgi:predicted DNA-binding WGR domain protein